MQWTWTSVHSWAAFRFLPHHTETNTPFPLSRFRSFILLEGITSLSWRVIASYFVLQHWTPNTAEQQTLVQWVYWFFIFLLFDQSSIRCFRCTTLVQWLSTFRLRRSLQSPYRRPVFHPRLMSQRTKGSGRRVDDEGKTKAKYSSASTFRQPRVKKTPKKQTKSKKNITQLHRKQ